jgi:hypothetical protein
MSRIRLLVEPLTTLSSVKVFSASQLVTLLEGTTLPQAICNANMHGPIHIAVFL